MCCWCVGRALAHEVMGRLIGAPLCALHCFAGISACLEMSIGNPFMSNAGTSPLQDPNTLNFVPSMHANVVVTLLC
jgi:hypothetical protein